MNDRRSLKRKLGAALDALTDADGFVLIASSDEISFTTLKAARFCEDQLLELEPLNAAEAHRDWSEAAAHNQTLREKNTALERDIAENQKLLAKLQAAIAVATGERGA